METMHRDLIHPGEHIADELAALDMSAAQLARDLAIPANRLTEIIRGRRGISADTDLRLARWMGTSPQFWMILERNEELTLSEPEHGAEVRKGVCAHPLGTLPAL